MVANFELDKHKEVKKILTEYEMREKDYGNIVLTEKIKVYILELPKIERMKSEDKNLNLWIKFIKDLEVKHMADNKEKDEKLEETIKAIQEAKKKYEELCQDEHARYIAELREKYIEETASVRQMGYEEGLEKGLEKEKKEIEQAKQTLENSKKELATQKASKQSVSLQLKTSKSEKDKYVSQLSEEEKQLQSRIDQLKKDNQSIDAKIRAKQAEIEAALKRQQEQSRNNSNSGSNNSSSNSGTSSSGFIKPVNSYVTTGMYYSSGAYHGAVDFGAAGVNGMPVYAAADGIVHTTAALTTSYGNYVIIAHYNGLYTLYAHGQAGSICVSEEQAVKKGQQIMRVGSTGNSTGPHLHFEVRKSPGTYSCRVNPLSYLP